MELDSDQEEMDSFEEELDIKIETLTIGYLYHDYLRRENILQLQPIYQRDFCWSFPKMILFLDSIYHNFIIPNFVIYKLSPKERREKKYFYECIDGQHRFMTIQSYIEGIPIEMYGSRHSFITIQKERVFYQLDQDVIEMYNKKDKLYHYRNMTLEEKDKLDRFQLSIHFISSQTGLSLLTKCHIFNRLQNGERVQTYIKVKNYHHPLTNLIREKNLISHFKKKKLHERIITKKKKADNLLLFLFIRILLIFDKKNLSINYLDLNINKYIYHDAPSVRIETDANLLCTYLIEFLDQIHQEYLFLEEFIFILACYYIHFGLVHYQRFLSKLSKTDIQYWCDEKIYHDKDKITSADTMNQKYLEFVSRYSIL